MMPADYGPTIGSRFPDVSLPDQHGEQTDVHAHRNGRRALVVFVRSAGWCPFCKATLAQLQTIAAHAEANDIAIYTISYDPVDVLAGFADRQGITFTMLSDVGSVAITELGMLDEDLDSHHGEFGRQVQDFMRGVAYPGAFIFDEAGTVVDKRVHGMYRERDSGSSLLEQAFNIASPNAPTQEVTGPAVTMKVRLDSPTYGWFQRVHLTLELDIAEGWHVYTGQIPDGYVGLSMSVETGDLDIDVRPIEWDKDPKPFAVDGLDEQFEVVDGLVTATTSMVFRSEPGAGTISLPVSVRYQACSASECARPSSITATLSLEESAIVESTIAPATAPVTGVST